MVGVSFQALLAKGGGAAALTSITQVLSATSTSSTINFPGGIQSGDLIVLIDRGFQASTTPPADVTPTGFTRVGSSLTLASGLASVRQNAWYKKADGTESGALTGLNADFANDKVMIVFRGNTPASTLTLGGSGAEITDGNPAAQNCPASGGLAPLVVLGAYGSSGAVNPRTFSTTKDGEVNSSTSLYLAWKIYNSSPANSSIDMDDEGNLNTLQSFYIQMA